MASLNKANAIEWLKLRGWQIQSDPVEGKFYFTHFEIQTEKHITSNIDAVNLEIERELKSNFKTTSQQGQSEYATV